MYIRKSRIGYNNKKVHLFIKKFAKKCFKANKMKARYLRS